MAQLLKSVKGLDELLQAQVRESSLASTEFRTWVNLMSIYPYLPEPGVVYRVGDLGCGSGRMTIALAKAWDANVPEFWLIDGEADSDEIGQHQWKAFKNNQTKGFYNRQKITQKFLTTNGVENCTFVTIDKACNWSQLPESNNRLELLISMYAVGTHYPIEMYQRIWSKVLIPGAKFIFTYDKRTGTIPDYFEVIDRKPDPWKQFAKDPRSQNSRNELVATIFRG